jgi:hypothetical protein
VLEMDRLLSHWLQKTARASRPIQQVQQKTSSQEDMAIPVPGLAPGLGVFIPSPCQSDLLLLGLVPTKFTQGAGLLQQTQLPGGVFTFDVVSIKDGFSPG